jgi:hypothetical protein
MFRWGLDSPHDQRGALLRELVNVLFRSGVAAVQAAFKEVRELVELAKLPLRVGRVPARADG